MGGFASYYDRKRRVQSDWLRETKKTRRMRELVEVGLKNFFESLTTNPNPRLTEALTKHYSGVIQECIRAMAQKGQTQFVKKTIQWDINSQSLPEEWWNELSEIVAKEQAIVAWLLEKLEIDLNKDSEILINILNELATTKGSRLREELNELFTFLESFGFTAADLHRLFTQAPNTFGKSTERIKKGLLTLRILFRENQLAIIHVITHNPAVLNISDAKLKEHIDHFQRLFLTTEQAARAAELSPLLLTYAPETLDKNFKHLQKTLDLSEEETKKIIGRYPTALGLKTETIHRNTTGLKSLFHDGAGSKRAVLRQPALLGSRPETLEKGLTFFRERIQLSNLDSAFLCTQNPSILQMKPETVEKHIQELELLYGKEYALFMIKVRPGILSFNPETLQRYQRELEIFFGDKQKAAQVAALEPALVTQSDETRNKNFANLTELFGEVHTRDIVYLFPYLMLLNAETINKKWSAFKTSLNDRAKDAVIIAVAYPEIFWFSVTKIPALTKELINGRLTSIEFVRSRYNLSIRSDQELNFDEGRVVAPIKAEEMDRAVDQKKLWDVLQRSLPEEKFQLLKSFLEGEEEASAEVREILLDVRSQPELMKMLSELFE